VHRYDGTASARREDSQVIYAPSMPTKPYQDVELVVPSSLTHPFASSPPVDPGASSILQGTMQFGTRIGRREGRRSQLPLPPHDKAVPSVSSVLS
jgi:hypothetical protein